MKVYQITKKNNAPNVFGISLVAEPAMESDYVKLSKERTDNLTVEQKITLSNQNDIKLSEVNKEKRLLMGLVLEPNKLIYRYDQQTKEEYYITVSEETILELANDYAKNSNQNYSTIEHDGRELDGVTFAQNWVVEDSKIDKSALHGMSYKKGSWASIAKIDNDTLWNEYIETGKVMGFSIDAMVHLEEINLNKETMSEQKTVIEMIKDLPNQIKMALTPQKEVEEVKEVEVVKLADEPAAADAEPTEEPATELTLESLAAEIENIKKVLSEMGVEFGKVVKDAIEQSNVELKKEVETLKTEVVELGKQPASLPIVSAPKQTDVSRMTNVERMQYNRANN